MFEDKNDKLSEVGEEEDNSWTKVPTRHSFTLREVNCSVKTAMTVTKETQNSLLSLDDKLENKPEDICH